MRELQLASFHCFQLELPGQTSKIKEHNQPRATSSASSLLKLHGSRASIRSKSSNSFLKSASNHKCLAVDNTIKSKDSQQILIGSALRRPHATSYSPLDYQTMPDAGKAPKQPYRSQSAATVYRYANRPLSAVQVGTSHGKQTKSSLLRNKSISCDSIASKTSTSSSTESRPSSGNKRLCQIRDDYRFFKNEPPAKQIPPHGQALHSFLTGARYNNSRCLDSRALSKLGVYISKSDLKTFFVKDLSPKQCDGDDSDNSIEYELNMSETEENMSSSSTEVLVEPRTKEKAVNTESNFLSIQRWNSAEWHASNRKPTKEKASRAHTAPSRFKPVTSFYHDYNTGAKYRYGGVS